jgi:precorrin-2 dehydrogenase/sirohydrochlorin ferrochelatase
MARHYPICLSLEGKPCLVVGGGAVALRKVRSLLGAGAEVTVVSPEFCEELRQLAGVRRVERTFDEGDAAGALLVYAATDDATANSAVAAAARKQRALVNVVDTPAECDFIVPSTLARGELTISVSTGGASPALARRLRLELEEQFPPAYADFVALLAELRREVLATVGDAARREAIFRRLAEKSAWDAYTAAGPAGVRELVRRLAR